MPRVAPVAGVALQRLADWLARPLQVDERAELVGGAASQRGEAGSAGAVARAVAIVVLGAPLDERGQLTEVGRERARAAAALWHLGGAERVLPTGGVTRGQARSEAAALAEELGALGVPGAAILLEEQARTTAENARCCAALLREQPGQGARPAAGAEERARGGAGGAADPREGGRAGALLGPVWLVTQPFHTRRARLCFRRAGVTAWVWPMADSVQHRDPRRALRWSSREYLAWAKALVVR